MGRYYSGDIDGKFWFAVQDSDAADRFGVTGNTPNYLEYYFTKENIPEIKAEIKKIEASIDVKKIKDFFGKDGRGYNDKDLIEAGIDPKEIKEYADLELGKKILRQVETYGECSFDAEC